MKKLWKRAGASTLVVGMLAGMILGPMAAWAEGTTTLTFNFTANQLENAPGITLYAYSGTAWDAIENGKTGDGIGVRVDGVDDRSFGLDLEDGARQRIDIERVSAVCENETRCTLKVSGVDTTLASNGIHFVTAGDSSFDLYFTDHGHYDMTTTNLLTDTDFIIEYRMNEFEEFDGRAYAIWACGENDSEVCLHLIEGIENSGSATEYYAASTITDIKNVARTFDQFGMLEDEDYARGMALASSVERWVVDYTGNENATVEDVDWSKVDIHQFLRGENKGEWEARLIADGTCAAGTDEDTLHGCVDDYFDKNGLVEGGGVKLQPVGESQGESSYTSYGDRNFRLTIYDDSYRAIELGDLSDLNYVPVFYEDATFVDAIDISKTTKETPAVMQSVLLEKTINIKAATVGGLEIASIKAIEIPADAVTISESNGEYKIVFNSNFYDKVTFAITDKASKVYYLRIERSVLDTSVGESGARVNFFFDAATKYSDYELVATYVYEDGTMVQKTMKNAEAIDDGLGNMTYDFETAGGKNLKVATYHTVEKSEEWLNGLEGVYFNVRMAGSTDTVYNGTLAGSGLGIYEPSPRNRGER